MSVYFDASVIVPMFLPDVFNERIETYIETEPTDVVISDFVSAEFASVVGLRLRMGSLVMAGAREALLKFDVWVQQYAVAAETQARDVHAAQAMLRRLDLVLRTPDAISLAIALRLGAELATFDVRMADCARALGMAVVAL
ncbi:MAG TPA: type II toxin-antitoxin system VapC family toxin [Rhizomicrobium sp.]